jgi:hypothetical protein
MNFLKLPLTCLLVISTAFAIPVAGQKRRGPDKPAVKTPAAPAPAPVTPLTIDTLLAADSYKIYAEVRGVGQLIRSNAANELLDPILQLGGPPKDFVDVVNWLKGHADDLMTSRMVIAAWPTFKEVPDSVVAIEMPTADDAAKFEAKLNEVLPTILPPIIPQSSPEVPPEGLLPEEVAERSPQAKKQAEQTATDKPKEAATPVPGYYLQRADSLIIISPKPVQLKKLRPKGSKPFSEDANFRVAYNRFSSEPIFVFVNVNAIQKESEERQKQYEEERKKAEEAEKAEAEKRAAEGEKKEGESGEEEEMIEEAEAEAMEPAPEVTPAIVEPPKEPTEAEMLSGAINSLRYTVMGVVPDIPDAIGIGFSPQNDSFDVRVLLVDAPGERSDPIPIFTGLTLGDQISPESPRVLPADSQLVVTMALDLETIYARTAILEQENDSVVTTASFGPRVHVAPSEIVSPLKTIERILKISAKDELLPLLGSEISISLPVASFNPFGPPRSTTHIPAKDGEKDKNKPVEPGPYVLVSLRDKEGMRRLMPRILEGFAGKAAAALAQTERREDTELVSVGDIFAYAFVGNFLVLSTDAATTRHVVDSYLKGETLAADNSFKNYTRWQPLQLHGQIYVSPALAESYRTWANNPSSQISDEARGFLTRLSTAPQPITYSLSNDGLGALHELHVPKSFLLLTVASIASTSNPPETVKNERMAMSTLWQVANAQRNYKEQNGTRYGSFEELVAAELLSKDVLKSENYRFTISITAEGFEVSAVPAVYGKTGKLSLFIDHSGIVRGGDHGGGAATASDEPIGG